ncbi:hypothetical protein WR25_20348 isoform A [Diploscapter pachys]|uniref:Uncharacterized protein n=1 Tax=Diploscapter pachys TaxID=2018661 RepID=A0A2A2LKN9_9BILA|nr:hypothetical protein WR25_20348 isoform A [Diploscapter pachys]
MRERTNDNQICSNYSRIYFSNNDNDAIIGEIAEQTTTMKQTSTSASSTSPPSTLPLSCDPRYGKYLINAFIDNTKSDSNLISQKAGGTLLDLYDYVIAGNDQNSRVVIGGAIDSYIPTNQNCTSASGRSCIQSGIKILEDSRNVFDFAFNFTGSTQQFLNSNAAKFGDDEKPPIIIWFLSILPNDGLAGLKYSLNLAQAAGYTVLGIATDSDTFLMKAALDQALGQNATFLYTNPQDTAYWIRKKLCDIKPAPPPAGTRMGHDYINNGANCTDEKSIADALTAITDGQIDPPDFDMNITRSVKTFANRKISFYDIDAEANPVAILWLANMPDDVVSGLNFAKSDFDGLEYNVIVINMDPTNSWIRNIAEQAWPLEQVWDYYSDEDVVRWIQYKLCQIKNGGFTFTPAITPTAPSTQPLVRKDPYYIAHFMDCGSSLYYYYDIFLTYLGNILFSNQSGTRFILGGMNQTSYSYYNANVTSLSQIKPAKQNLFDQCHDLNYKINPAVQQFANTDLINYDEKNEAPPVALLALGKKNLDSLLGLHTGIQKLRSLNFVVIAIDFSNDEDMNATLTEELGPTNFTTFTDYYNTSLWVVHYLCTYVKDCGALVTGTPTTTPVQTTISTLTPPTGATSPSQAPSASTSNSQPATSPTSPASPTAPVSSSASSSPQGSSSAPVTTVSSQQSSSSTPLPPSSSSSNPASSLPISTLPSTSPSQSTVPQQTTTPFTPTTTQPPTS